MTLTAAASGFIIFLLSVQVVQGQYAMGVTYTSPSKMCVLKGSTVDIHCTYRYSSRVKGTSTVVKETFWFTKESNDVYVDLTTDSEYAGRVQYHCVKNDCTLRITDLRESDSAEYKFRFITNQSGGRFTGSPGVTLTVTDLQVRRSQHSWSKKLMCHSSCLPPRTSYIWYKNGQKIQDETSTINVNLYSSDSYSCAVKGFEHHPAPSVCVYGQSCNRVIYTDRSICAFRGSSVDISCTYSSYGSITSKFWFSPERSHQWQNSSQPEDLSEDSQYAGRIQVLEIERGRSTLRISDLRESDSAQYHFTFKTQWFEWGSSLPGTTLTVTDPNLQVMVNISGAYQYSTWAELKCHSRCLPERSSFIWYKNGQKIQDQTSSTYEKYFYPADSYSCAVEGFEHHPAPSVCVHGQSCNRVIYTDRSICAFRGSSVDISCTYSSSSTYYRSKFWFNPERSHQWRYSSQPEDLNEDSQYAGRVQVLETEGGRSTLRISDLRENDTAQYHFTFKTRSFEWGSSLPGTTLTVTALQVQVITITVHQSYTEAELKCLSSCSPAGRISYIWFKNGQKVMNEETSLYSGQFNPGDNVSCALKGHEDCSSPSVYAPMPPSVSVSPSDDIIEGSSVTLTCSSDTNPAGNTWYKKNVNPDLQPLSKEPQLIFSFIQSSDSGEYYCTAENQLGKRTSKHIFIDVKYAPKLPSVSVSPSGEIVQGSSVTLNCSSDANPAATYTWHKENQTLLHGPGNMYHFTSISSEDSGVYHCKSENQYGQINSSNLIIDVQYAPKLPSVLVSPSGEIVEGSSVNLTCSSDTNPAANYTWYKENEDSPKASGQIFTITDVRPEHSGNYYCEAQNRRGRHNSTLYLTVVAGKSVIIMNIIRVILVVLMLIALLLLSLWTRKKKTLSSNAGLNEPVETIELDSSPVYENVSDLKVVAAAQTEDTEEQEDVE